MSICHMVVFLTDTVPSLTFPSHFALISFSFSTCLPSIPYIYMLPLPHFHSPRDPFPLSVYLFLSLCLFSIHRVRDTFIHLFIHYQSGFHFHFHLKHNYYILNNNGERDYDEAAIGAMDGGCTFASSYPIEALQYSHPRHHF